MLATFALMVVNVFAYLACYLYGRHDGYKNAVFWRDFARRHQDYSASLQRHFRERADSLPEIEDEMPTLPGVPMQRIWNRTQ